MTDREFYAIYIYNLEKGLSDRLKDRETILNAILNANRKSGSEAFKMSFEERIEPPSKAIVKTEEARQALFAEFGHLDLTPFGLGGDNNGE
ncbi:hypothetical protein [Listeria ilorinensis]|uniref:hypothetical protein n=1 Tax=Listeria ilorinensis TaxID=2867439 RepID=UPI001EF4FE94|nr:hypothetical protein [Listeria ilorinensis]